jgi:sulfonate transport system ATP-binding protein
VIPNRTLRLRGLTKDFGSHRVIGGIDLDIPYGQFVAVIGQSGCGKSTLLRLIAGLEAATAGQFGFGSSAPDPIRGSTCLLFQEPRLLPWRSVLANVALGLPADRQPDARAALQRVGLDSYADAWPAVLSGGQKQRVSLARALIREPNLLLMDEPLGALDALTRIEMQRLIESVWLQRRFTALLVTHDVAEAIALADRVLLLERGEIVCDLSISLPRPRRRNELVFTRLEAEVLGWVLPPESP